MHDKELIQNILQDTAFQIASCYWELTICQIQCLSLYMHFFVYFSHNFMKIYSSYYNFPTEESKSLEGSYNYLEAGSDLEQGMFHSKALLKSLSCPLLVISFPPHNLSPTPSIPPPSPILFQALVQGMAITLVKRTSSLSSL